MHEGAVGAGTMHPHTHMLRARSSLLKVAWQKL